MEIGILTYCKAVNYGAYLQAFSLGKYLESKGHDVQYISINSLKSKYWEFHNLYAYHIDRIPFRNVFRKKWRNAQKLLKKVSKRKHFDLIIIGSDEMWQLNNQTVTPLPEYFGLGLNADKIITYAVCSNGTTVSALKKYSFIKKGIEHIDFISVRDEMTKSVYQTITDKKIQQHIDPTFLVDLEEYVVEPELKDYLLVYTYGFNEEKKEVTKKFASQNKLKIVAVGNKFDWCDFSVPASPFETLGLFKNAKYVVTDTFHGTVLSVHFHKQFFSFAVGKEKIEAFLKEFDMENRICNSKSFEELKNNPIDYSLIDLKISKKKEESNRYFERVLDVI